MIVLLESLLLGSAINWVSVYLALELQTLALFVLVALNTNNTYGAENGLKYYVQQTKLFIVKYICYNPRHNM